MSGWIRRLIAGEFYRDYDIANCAPVLLSQILQRNGMSSVWLAHYIEKREEIFKQYATIMSRSQLKQLFLSVIHMGKSDIDVPETGLLYWELRRLLLRLST